MNPQSNARASGESDVTGVTGDTVAPGGEVCQ